MYMYMYMYRYRYMYMYKYKYKYKYNYKRVTTHRLGCTSKSDMFFLSGNQTAIEVKRPRIPSPAMIQGSLLYGALAGYGVPGKWNSQGVPSGKLR